MSFSIKLVQNSVRKCLLLEIGVETFCATVGLLEIGAMCKKAKNLCKTEGATENVPELAR